MSKYDPSSMKISTGCSRAFTIDDVRDCDVFQYSLCINTWCCVVQDLAGWKLAESLRSVIDAAGLYAIIESADKAAGRILNGETQLPLFNDDLFGLWVEICDKAARNRAEGEDPEEWMAIATGLALRFPKRFTIDDGTMTNLDDFLECQSSCHRMNAVWSARPGETILTHVAYNMNRILEVIGSEVFPNPKDYWDNESIRRDKDLSITMFNPDGSVYETNAYDMEWDKSGYFLEEEYRKDKMRTCRLFKLRCWEASDGDDPKYWAYRYLSSLRLKTPFSSGACFYPLGFARRPENPELEVFTSRELALKYAYVCSCGRFDLVGIPTLDEDWGELKSILGHFDYDRLYPRHPGFHCYSAMLAAVPKNYAEKRLIAPETPLLNVLARRAREVLMEIAGNNGFAIFMNTTDQSVNRELARRGSLSSAQRDSSMNYCTIDARHASDSIPRLLFFEVLRYVDPSVRYLIRTGLADQLYYKGIYHIRPQILATSGSPLTPFLQSIYYLAIVMTAYDYCHIPYEHWIEVARDAHRWSEEVDDEDKFSVPFAVYNDDIIVKEEAFQTVIDMLSMFNITVNTTKTFHGSNPYRESCGGEFSHGVDITGCYWPRKPIETNKFGKLRTEAVSALVSLQHRLHARGLSEADMYLQRAIMGIVPSMTSSRPFEDSDDLWMRWRSEYTDAVQPHYQTVSTYSKPDTSFNAKFGKKVIETLSYLSFLKDGPIYRDDLDAILGISEPRVAYKHSTEVAGESSRLQKPSVKA